MWALALPVYQDAGTEQKKVVRHYLDRSRELARATLLVADAGLVVPTSLFMRVLCEDLFLITYAAASEENASRLAGAGVVAMAHAAAVNLQRGRAHIRKIGTTEDHTDEVLPEIRKRAADRFNIEQIAKDVGLGGIYDVVYRYASLEVHGKTFGIFSSDDGNGAIMPTLHAIIAMLNVIIRVADNCVVRGQPTAATDILQELVIG